MILDNAKPKLEEAIALTTLTGQSQEVKFIYNELVTYDTITSVFNWLFREGIDFTTKREEYRFVVIIHPKSGH